MRTSRFKIAGFSLLELSVVLLILSTIIGVGVSYVGLSVEKAQRDTTTQRMRAIQKALLDHRRAFHAIPCPSDITLAVTNTAFGRGDIQENPEDPCDGATYMPNYQSGNNWVGGIPVRTLKLPDEYAFDGWGRRFTYVVDDTVTGRGSFNLFKMSDNIGDIEIVDAEGNTLESQAVYALISHGPNGHGGYSRYGTSRIGGATISANELKNCGCNLGGVHSAFSTEFVQAPYTTDTGSGETFDDIVVYGTRRSLRHFTE